MCSGYICEDSNSPSQLLNLNPKIAKPIQSPQCNPSTRIDATLLHGWSRQHLHLHSLAWTKENIITVDKMNIIVHKTTCHNKAPSSHTLNKQTKRHHQLHRLRLKVSQHAPPPPPPTPHWGTRSAAAANHVCCWLSTSRHTTTTLVTQVGFWLCHHGTPGPLSLSAGVNAAGELTDQWRHQWTQILGQTF